MLKSGELHLSALKLLGPVLDQENARELLESARFKSKRELERLLAARVEKPSVANVIRKLPQPSAPTAHEPPSLLTFEVAAPSAPPAERHAPSVEAASEPRAELRPAARGRARPSLEPLGTDRYKLQLTASQSLHDKLQQARDLMRHELPDGDLAKVVEWALDSFIAERMKQRFGFGRKAKARRPATNERKPKPGSRHIPHEVRREVLARDGVRCTFVSVDGRRCSERGQLELHHDEPFARGGPATASNIRLLCRAHNFLLAERDYGQRFIRERIERARPAQVVPPLAPGPAIVPAYPTTSGTPRCAAVQMDACLQSGVDALGPEPGNTPSTNAPSNAHAMSAP